MQTMAAFLVEVGAYANAISPFSPHPSAPFAYKRSCRFSAKDHDTPPEIHRF